VKGSVILIQNRQIFTSNTW